MSTPEAAWANPDKVAMGLEGSSFVTVRVTTQEGAEYLFPDMPAEAIKAVLPESGRILADMPSLALVNVSMSVLTIPFRIIKTIHVGEELTWDCPA